jgi:hypothetical protein
MTYPSFVQNHGLHKNGIEFADLLCKAACGKRRRATDWANAAEAHPL